MSCMPIKHQSSKNSEVTYYEPYQKDIENFYVNMKKELIGRQTSMGFYDYEFTNEQDEYVCGGTEISTKINQYICVNRFTLDLTIKDSDTKEWSNKVDYKCEQVEKKF